MINIRPRRYPPIELPWARVVVTGGARGIGLATTRALVARGAQVWIGDLDPDVAREATSDIAEHVHVAELDVTQPASWEAFAAPILTQRAPDVLVNNAGIMPLGPFLDEPEAQARLTMAVNVWGPWHGLRTFAPAMIAAGRGHVVNVASMAGKMGVPGMVTYNASKYAAVGLTAGARAEFANTGVSVSTILPSAVRTELSSGAPLGKGMPTVDPEDIAAAVIANIASRRPEVSVPGYLGPAAEIANAVVPETLIRLYRRIIGDDRALTSLDHRARAAYTDRLAEQQRRTEDHASSPNDALTT